jgi:hypothetical protein
MSEMAVVTREILGSGRSSEYAITPNEQRLIQRFRQLTDQEKHQVLRLMEVLTVLPKGPAG